MVMNRRFMGALVLSAATAWGGCGPVEKTGVDDGNFDQEIGTAQTALANGAHQDPLDFLISDQFNNRVILVNGAHQVTWHFGDGSNVAGPTSVVAPNDAERVGNATLISGTGAPAGAEPGCDMGCFDNRVLFVDKKGKIFWQYGQANVTGAGPNELNAPVAAMFLPNGHILITDQGNARIIEVTKGKKIVWQYGQTGVSGAGDNQLNNPNSAMLLENGNILIADENNNRVIEVTRQNKIVWQYGTPPDTATLNGPAFASRLDNGNTLISDSLTNRVVEVCEQKKVVWSYDTSQRPGSVMAPVPTRAVRLRNGNTLISDQFNHQVIEVGKNAKPTDKLVFAQGAIGVAGSGFNQLNAPYDAKVPGDFTGLTPPFGWE